MHDHHDGFILTFAEEHIVRTSENIIHTTLQRSKFHFYFFKSYKDFSILYRINKVLSITVMLDVAKIFINTI